MVTECFLFQFHFWILFSFIFLKSKSSRDLSREAGGSPTFNWWRQKRGSGSERRTSELWAGRAGGRGHCSQGGLELQKGESFQNHWVQQLGSCWAWHEWWTLSAVCSVGRKEVGHSGLWKHEACASTGGVCWCLTPEACERDGLAATRRTGSLAGRVEI